MMIKSLFKSAFLMGALACAPLFTSCSDDDEGGNGGGVEMYIPASVVDGVRVSGVSSAADSEHSFSIDYNDDGTPASMTVGGQTFDFEYEAATRAGARAAVPTGKKLVRIGCRQYNDTLTGDKSSWVATNFAFNTDGFVASYQEVIEEKFGSSTEKVVLHLTFDYDNKGRIQRVGIQGTDSGYDDEDGNWQEHISTSLNYVYSGDALERAYNTYDGETMSYEYEYDTDAHANTYNVMTPQLAQGVSVYSPILYCLAFSGFMGNASAFLPTKCTYRSYSDYGGEDPDYNDVEVYDITYTFWDNNKIHTMVSTMPTGAKNEYSYTYFDK